MKQSISEFTEQESLDFVKKICNADFPSEELLDQAVEIFENVSEHPAKSDLIYYSNDGEHTPEVIVEKVKSWRLANNKTGFKPL